MMVCMPRTCGVFSSTLSVFGRGCPWWAEARAALQQGSSDQSCTAYAHRATTPDPPRVGHSPRPKDSSSRRTHRTGWTPESASSSLGKSQVWYQVQNPRAVPPRRTGTNLPRPHTQQSAASARPSLCLHPGSESSSSAQARPCYTPWDRAAWAAPRHEDCPTEAGYIESQRTRRTVQDTSPTEGSSMGQSNAQGRNHTPERDSAGSPSHESSIAAVGRVMEQPAATARQPPRSRMQGSHLGSRGRAAAHGHLGKALASRDRGEAGLGEERVLAAHHPQPRNRPLCG